MIVFRGSIHCNIQRTKGVNTRNSIHTAVLHEIFNFSAGNYMFKINNRNTGTRCEICSKLIMKIPERRYCSSVSIVNFEHVNTGWVNFQTNKQWSFGKIYVKRKLNRIIHMAFSASKN